MLVLHNLAQSRKTLIRRFDPDSRLPTRLQFQFSVKPHLAKIEGMDNRDPTDQSIELDKGVPFAEFG